MTLIYSAYTVNKQKSTAISGSNKANKHFNAIYAYLPVTCTFKSKIEFRETPPKKKKRVTVTLNTVSVDSGHK